MPTWGDLDSHELRLVLEARVGLVRRQRNIVRVGAGTAFDAAQIRSGGERAA
jgi:hypothetical protein